MDNFKHIGTGHQFPPWRSARKPKLEKPGNLSARLRCACIVAFRECLGTFGWCGTRELGFTPAGGNDIRLAGRIGEGLQVEHRVPDEPLPERLEARTRFAASPINGAPPRHAPLRFTRVYGRGA